MSLHCKNNFNLMYLFFCCFSFYFFSATSTFTKVNNSLYSYCCCNNNIEFTSHVCLHIVLNRAQDIYGETKKLNVDILVSLNFMHMKMCLTFSLLLLLLFLFAILSDWCRIRNIFGHISSIANFSILHMHIHTHKVH